MESSRRLLEALWSLDEEAVATGIEKVHEEVSILQYNDENALSCTISLASKLFLSNYKSKYIMTWQ